MLAKDITLINKPKGISSAQAVTIIKKRLGIKKAGHAGTLDKEASGLLIIGLGKGTKKLSDYQKLPKEYWVKIKLGVQTDTDDLSGRVIQKKSVKNISLKKIEKTLRTFLGKREQLPPVYSAVKIKGKPAYKLARKGKTVNLKPRTVELIEAEIKKFEPPYLVLIIKTSKGFYVRSLVRDLGEKLSCGATVAALTRTAIGPYLLSRAQAILEKPGQFEN